MTNFHAITCPLARGNRMRVGARSEGHDITGWEMVRMASGKVFQDPRVFPSLSAEENVVAACELSLRRNVQRLLAC